MIEKVYEFKKDATTKVVEKIVNTEHVQINHHKLMLRNSALMNSDEIFQISLHSLRSKEMGKVGGDLFYV
ncbi:hypothetical protein [Methanocaldococcus sp.]